MVLVLNTEGIWGDTIVYETMPYNDGETIRSLFKRVPYYFPQFPSGTLKDTEFKMNLKDEDNTPFDLDVGKTKLDNIESYAKDSLFPI